ncbi:MAG: iron-sulfur cluster biosynthesis family protein [Pseudomonadota bacterium]
MINITPAAAEQILKSFQNNNSSPANNSSVLRIAVQQKPDGGFHYIMGLDEAKKSDSRFISNKVQIAVAEEHIALMDKMEIDFVEINPDEFNFIFKNPNDPKYQQPTK